MRFIRAEEVDAVWNQVVKGIEVVRRLTQEPWNADDVHRQLIAGQAHLFLHPHGFLITQASREDFSCRPYVNVWIAWFEPNKAKEHRAELIAFLDEISGRNWKFNSPREGWTALEGLEMEVERIVYRRKKQ